jgi:cation diffusion facilitator CzcD-associated flavoprotein CzcO
VDVRSAEYSYSWSSELQQEWNWKEVFAPQAELLSYVHHVLDRFDLRKTIEFNSKVSAAHWDEDKKCWKVTVLHHAEEAPSINDILPGKEAQYREAHEGQYEADFLIFATGCLSAPNLPKWPGFDTYKGTIHHTARWADGTDLTGKKVAVIGTGSSAVQSIPIIAKQAAELTVFQRTATYSIPAHNRPLKPEDVAKDKANYAELRARQQTKPGCIDWDTPTRRMEEFSREEIDAELERRWQIGGLGLGAAFMDSMTNKAANDELKKFIHKKIKDIVKDPKTAEMLCPDQVVTCKVSFWPVCCCSRVRSNPSSFASASALTLDTTRLSTNPT